MNRTGSMASAVPPAVITMWRPSRSGSRTGAASGRPGRLDRLADRAAGDGLDHRVDDPRQLGEAPDAGLARGELAPRRAGPSGYPKSCCSRSTLARVAGWDHMSPSIAGATTTGADVARTAAVTVSPASPLAIAPSQWAVAGATTIASAVSATTMCPMRPSGRRPRTSVSTGVREAPREVSGPPTSPPTALGLTTTSAPSARSRRTSSTALYAAIDPHTPRPMSRPERPRAAVIAPVDARQGSPPATSACRIARPLSVRSGSMTSTPSTPLAQGAADRPPVRIVGRPRARRRRSRQLGPDALEQTGGERLVAEDRAGLHRADRVAADRPVRRAQLDPRQLGGPRRERLEPELEARRDRPADVGAVCRHAIEGRGGSEVDDDGRRAVEPGGRQRVHEPIGPDLGRPIDPDGDRHGVRARDEHREAAPGSRPPRPRPSGGHDGRHGHGIDIAERAAVEAEEALEQHLQLVGGSPRGSWRPAGSRRARRPPRARA